jgi:ubiquinone/menaquinone biosynthesis C-methylase UbiE
MASVDVYGRTEELDAATLNAIITRLESRAQQPVFARMIDDYLSRLPLASMATVLDLGCGTGVAARASARRPEFRGEIVGIDISPALIEAARRLSAAEGVGGRIDYRVGDTHALDLADGSFNAVIAHTLVSHVRDPPSVLKEAARLVVPGGWVVVFDGDYASLTLGTKDPEYGAHMDAAIIKTIVTNPRVMRSMPGLLRDAGLELAGSLSYVVTEIGKADFWGGLLKSLRVLLPKAGIVSDEEAQAFVDAQCQASDEGTFFGSSNYLTYIARRV